MITIGADVHLKTTTMTVLNHDGVKITRRKLNNDPDELLEFVRGFSGPKQFAMESCYNWPVVYELMNKEFDQFHLLHAQKMKNIVESQSKCDKHDADEIAQMTHRGYIPRAHTADAQTRQYRSLLRTRMRIVQNITGIKNHIQAILNSNTFYSQRPKNFKDVFCKRGLAYLKGINFPLQQQFVIDGLLKQKESLEHLKNQFNEHIQSLNIDNPNLKILRTAPGMNGKILNHIVLAEIDNIHRFGNSDALLAYAGLVPRNQSSGGKERKGRLRTACNQYLKWAMIEAAIPAMIKDKSLRDYYKKVKESYHGPAAKIAVARRLLRSIYHILKEQRPYYYSNGQPLMAHA